MHERFVITVQHAVDAYGQRARFRQSLKGGDILWRHARFVYGRHARKAHLKQSRAYGRFAVFKAVGRHMFIHQALRESQHNAGGFSIFAPQDIANFWFWRVFINAGNGKRGAIIKSAKAVQAFHLNGIIWEGLINQRAVRITSAAKITLIPALRDNPLTRFRIGRKGFQPRDNVSGIFDPYKVCLHSVHAQLAHMDMAVYNAGQDCRAVQINTAAAFKFVIAIANKSNPAVFNNHHASLRLAQVLGYYLAIEIKHLACCVVCSISCGTGYQCRQA